MLNIALICTQILIFKKLFPLVFKIFQNFVKNNGEFSKIMADFQWWPWVLSFFLEGPIFFLNIEVVKNGQKI